MPHYVLIGRDGPRGAELRLQHRPAHIEGMEALYSEGRVLFGGPLLDEAGVPHGSVIVFEAADLAEARRIAERDPYVAEGVFAEHEVHATHVVFPHD